MSFLRAIRWIAWGLIGLISLGVGAFWLTGGRITDGLRSLNSGTMVGGAIGGPFALVDQEGNPVSHEGLKGKPYILFFGFTHCPDACPTAMFELSQSLGEIGAAAGDLKAYFVTLDPQRDTPDLLKNYLSSFDPRIQALTGPVDKIDAMVRAWRAYYRRVPLEKGSYTIDHTTLIYLMDRRGAYFDVIRPNETNDARVRKIRALIARR